MMGNLPMQNIITNKNQEQVKELQTQDYDNKPYEAVLEPDEPVESAESPVYDPNSEDERQPTPEPVIGLFAIGKFCRYQQEALALTTIYGDRFTERIANSVWTITLALDFQADIAGGKQNASASTGGPRSLLGHLPAAGLEPSASISTRYPPRGKPRAQDPVGASQPEFSSPEYELEVCFPKGNYYPF
ncbi:hypothetical protein J4Q44_G00005710 [Coregonus suidteri]|uniref:Uncharacterized protein n=1 Tax=Coregonus suidteri TaxID=861788 RepID=A0AAN8R8Z6_9TELE